MSAARFYLLWLCCMSLVTFLVMGSDKRRAMRGARRATGAKGMQGGWLLFLLLALLGGGVGGLLGMYAFRHKTRHLHFALGFPLIAAAQILGALYLLQRI